MSDVRCIAISFDTLHCAHLPYISVVRCQFAQLSRRRTDSDDVYPNGLCKKSPTTSKQIREEKISIHLYDVLEGAKLNWQYGIYSYDQWRVVIQGAGMESVMLGDLQPGGLITPKGR